MFSHTSSQKLQLPTADTALPGRIKEMDVDPVHYVTGNTIKTPFPQHCEQALFGMGCFWGAERKFWLLEGVYSTAVGYSAGITPNPTYEETCTGLTGHNEVVLVIDDLGDRGGTLQFLTQYIAEKGAKQVLTLALYMKPMAIQKCPADFSFGEVEQDTWIITPRETVETMIKRVPVWKERGADQRECQRRLVDIIGYPPQLAEYYLKQIFAA